jgi:tetratricopeptide (TPR) repeat protein
MTNDDAYTYYFQLKSLDPSNKALAEIGTKVMPRLKEIGDEVFRKKVSVQIERLIDQDWFRTLRVYEWAYSIDSKDRILEARLRFCQAEVAKIQGKKDEAERGFSATSQLAPTWALPVNSLGLLRTESKRWADSIPYYQKAIQLEPSWEIPYNNMGTAYLGQRDYMTSESWYRRALEINPNWSRPHWHIGSIYETTNRHFEALAEYQTAANLDPNGYSIDLAAAQKKIAWLQRRLQR